MPVRFFPFFGKLTHQSGEEPRYGSSPALLLLISDFVQDASFDDILYACDLLSEKYQVRTMEQIANLHIEKLPEGIYLATSDDIPGLVAQGRTITETLEIARDIAKKLLEAQSERHHQPNLTSTRDSFDYPLILSA